ncbi:divalent-cation tolerance protein CutA [Thermaurantiacus sp.]
MTALVSVYAVFAGEDEAERIGRAMVEAGLAACVNILGPCRSLYRWQGRVETAREVPAIFKAAAGRAQALVAAIAERHSYEVPAITVWPIDQALERYALWIAAETGAG